MNNKRGETFWSTTLSGIAALVWGGYITIYSVPLDDMPVYDVLSQHVPPYIWAKLALLIGFVQCFANLADYLTPRFPSAWLWCRWLVAWPALLWWEFLSVTMFNSGQLAPTAGIIAVLGIVGNAPMILLMIPLKFDRGCS